VSGAAYRYRPVLDRRPCDQTIRERAEFLAHEIHHDPLAPEAEIADALELEIKRFARPEELAAAAVDNGFRGSFRRVLELRRGPLKSHRNGTTAYEWAVLDLSCGHTIQHARSRNPRATAPSFAKCGQCRA
jgi:hypothetical protein